MLQKEGTHFFQKHNKQTCGSDHTDAKDPEIDEQFQNSHMWVQDMIISNVNLTV